MKSAAATDLAKNSVENQLESIINNSGGGDKSLNHSPSTKINALELSRTPSLPMIKVPAPPDSTRTNKEDKEESAILSLLDKIQENN